MTSASTCHRCATKLRPGDRFCPSCGTGTGGAASTDQGHQTPAETWEGILERISFAAAPRYRVIRLLGFGGFAGVYLAEEPRLGRRVAIKVMSPVLMLDAGLVSRFVQEARTTAQLNHPNIVTIYDVDEREGLHYFAMAYVAGRTLASIMSARTDPIPLEAALHWLHNIGSALAYAHRAGVIHRDVKPSNIMVDADGDARVTDFGIAKVADEPSLTRTGILVGTPTYMSPEQCLSGVITGASDQYSLGVVGYELLAGRPPFRGATLAVLHAHTNEVPAPIETFRADCPPHVAGAIMRMLAKDPHDRFPTMGAALNGLGAAPLADDDPIRELAGVLGASVEALALTPPPIRVQSRDAFTLAAIPHDAAGRQLSGRKVKWISENPDVAVVTDEGAVSVMAGGTTRILAECEGVVEAVPLVVADPVLSIPDPLAPTLPLRRTPVEPPPAPIPSASRIFVPDAFGVSRPEPPVYPSGADHENARPGGGGPEASRRPRLLFVGLAVGVVAIGTAAYLIASSAGSDPDPSAVLAPVNPPPPVPVAAPPPPAVLTAQVQVRQLPSGAQLTLDGMPVRDTLLDVVAGLDHVLVARAEGFLPDTHVVRLEAGGRASWRPTLRPRPEQRAPAVLPPPAPRPVQSQPPPPPPPPPPRTDTARAVEPPGVPADPAAQRAQFERERQQLLRAFENALESGDAAAVRSVYAGFTGEERWWPYVANAARPVDVTLQPRAAAECCAGDSARVQYGVGMSAGGTTVPLPGMQRFVFRRDAQGRWWIGRIY